MKNTKQFFNINIVPNYCSKMNESLYKKLSAYRETKERSFQIEQFLSDDSAFMNDFMDVCAFITSGYQKYPKYSDNLILMQSHQGTGKTTFLLNTLVQTQNTVLLIEPKKTNIEQIAKQYPFAVAFTSDSIQKAKQNGNVSLINPFTRFVVCVPELALKAYELLRFHHKNVEYCIFDEAHDIVQSVPAYRETENLFQMMEQAYDSNYTKLLFVTATPEPLQFIYFHDTYKIQAKKELTAQYMQLIQVKTKDPKHISMTKAYCAKLKEAKNNTNHPYMVFIDNKNMIENMKRILSLEGFNCQSITAEDNIADNMVFKMITEYQMLPNTANGRNIDFIFTTSTIISGISIHENPYLGVFQYQPIIIADEPHKTDIAAYQQFLCRFRYDLHHVCIFTKLLENAKKEMTVQEIEKIIKTYAKNTIDKIGLINENTSYIQEFLDNYQSITNPQSNRLDKFAVFCNAFREFNYRLYGHKESFMQELLRHFHVINPVQYFVYTPATADELEYQTSDAAAIQEIRMNRKMGKLEAARYFMENSFMIKEAFAADSKKDMSASISDSLNKLREETNTLELAYKIGGDMKVIEHLNAISQSDDSQKMVAKSAFQIEREAAFTELSLYSNKSTVLEIALSDTNLDQSKLSAKNKAIIRRFKETESFKLLKKVYDRVLNFDIIKEQYLKCETYHDIREWCRTINARKMLNAYLEGEMTLQEMSHSYIQGEELAIVLYSLELLQKKDIFIVPGISLSQQEINYIAQVLNMHLSLCRLTNKKPYDNKIVIHMIQDLIPCSVLYNDQIITTGTCYK